MGEALRKPDEPTLNLIPQASIDMVVPLIEGHLKSVVDRSGGLYTRDGILERFKDGTLQLWLVWDGGLCAVGATEISTTMSGAKICTIRFWTGENSIAWLHLIDELEAWAKAEGCKRMAGIMRKGWAKRLPAYKISHVYLEKDLS